MSYDLRIWTVEQPQLRTALAALGFEFERDSYVSRLTQGQIVIPDPLAVEAEDVPDGISHQLPGIRYLVEAHVEPSPPEPAIVKKLVSLGKAIGRDFRGVIEDPQTGEVLLPTGIRRLLDYERPELFTLLQLSWWFIDEAILSADRLRQMLDVIDRTVPEALPRRYGLYEPPKQKYESKADFVKYLLDNARKSIVWYPTNPVDGVYFSIPQKIGPTRIGYRFGYLSIAIDAAVIDMPGWSRSVNELFKLVTGILAPFYGDMYFLKDHVRSRTVSSSTGTSEQHPIVSWWWNGVPRQLGVGLVVGQPLSDMIRIKSRYETLDNGCRLVLPKEDDMRRPIKSNEVEMQDGLRQPTASQAFGVGQKRYPRIWIFPGPFAG